MTGNESSSADPEIPLSIPDEEIEIVSDYFTDEELLAAWNEFADRIKTDRPRMYNTLKGHLPERKDDQSIELVLDNTIQQEEFQEDIKHDLLIYLKEKT